MKWPDVYEYGRPIGPVDNWFAWHPVQLWWGKWVWLRMVRRNRITKKQCLSGDYYDFWTYEVRG